MNTRSGQLHDVSMKIGELLANVEGLAEQSHEARVTGRQLQAAINEVVSDVKQLKNDVAAMKPSVQRYDTDRSKILGAVAFVGTIAGVMSGVIWDYIKKVFHA